MGIMFRIHHETPLNTFITSPTRYFPNCNDIPIRNKTISWYDSIPMRLGRWAHRINNNPPRNSGAKGRDDE